MAVESSSLPNFTCITCRVAFRGAEIQRAHYKTDWHRYNLKRKVAELPPVSADTFQEKVLAQREAAGASSEIKHEVCTACKKHFTSKNSYDSHLRSRKHRDAVVALEKKEAKKKEGSVGAEKDEASPCDDLNQEDTETSEVSLSGAGGDSDCEPEPLEITECLFCPHQSKDLELNLSHMSKAHGFFIPELDYLVDLEGLVTYLCEKVGVGYMCLYCNEKGKHFHSVESVQQHMMDKSHCKLFFEGDAALEYAEYFDYSKSYPDYHEKNDGDDDENDHEEDSAGVNSLPSNASMEVNDSLEMVLPSGAKIGHRALKLFYRQRLPTQEQRKSALVSRLMIQYRAIGWKESAGKSGGGLLRQRGEAWGKRMQKARATKLSVKANKLQHHFRPQVVF